MLRGRRLFVSCDASEGAATGRPCRCTFFQSDIRNIREEQFDSALRSVLFQAGIPHR